MEDQAIQFGHLDSRLWRHRFFIPTHLTRYFLPVTIKQGYGELLITAYPENSTQLDIQQVIIGKTYAPYLYY